MLAVRTRRRTADEAGFTLVEMMLAIFVVGIVLSGLAATLLTSLRAATSNERETRATSYAQQEIEILQSVNWDFAGLYTQDVDAANAGWSDRLSGPGFYDGAELITIPGPASVAARVQSVPQPRSTIDDRGVIYTIDRYVTWIDRDGDGAPETRRFTVVATWDDREADRGITITAERAPTQGDTEATNAGGRVLQMSVSPSLVSLEDDQTLGQPVDVRVVLNQPAAPGTVEVFYYTLQSTVVSTDAEGKDVFDHTWKLEKAASAALDANDTLAVAQPGAEHTRFRFTIPASARMVEGVQELLFVGKIDGRDVSRYATLTLINGKLEGTNPTPPAPEADPDPSPLPVIPKPEDGETTPGPTDEVKLVSAVPGTLCVHPATWVPAKDFTIPLTIRGLTETNGTVSVSYQYRSRNKTGNGHLEAANESATFVSGGATTSQWLFGIQAGSSRLFQPGASITFTVRASRQDGSQSDQVTRSARASTSC